MSLEKKADFKLGKSFKDDGSGVKATRAPKEIDELLKDDSDISKPKTNSKNPANAE
jgi:hypothetical protein